MRFAQVGEHVPYVGTLKGSNVAYAFGSWPVAREWAAYSGGTVWPVVYEVSADAPPLPPLTSTA